MAIQWTTSWCGDVWRCTKCGATGAGDSQQLVVDADEHLETCFFAPARAPEN